MTIQDQIDQIRADRNAYIANDCNGHDMNQRMRAMDMFTNELEDLYERQEQGEV